MMDAQQLKRTTLATVPDAEAFRVCRGDVILNIKDLANCFEHLTPEQFSHHVSPSGNHVAGWVEHVLKNQVLANDLSYPINLTNQQHFVKTIRDHVTWLESV